MSSKNESSRVATSSTVTQRYEGRYESESVLTLGQDWTDRGMSEHGVQSRPFPVCPFLTVLFAGKYLAETQGLLQHPINPGLGCKWSKVVVKWSQTPRELLPKCWSEQYQSNALGELQRAIHTSQRGLFTHYLPSTRDSSVVYSFDLKFAARVFIWTWK